MLKKLNLGIKNGCFHWSTPNILFNVFLRKIEITGSEAKTWDYWNYC
jgi:hypothetical protein